MNPSARIRSPLTVSDDVANNQITIEEHYELGALWKDRSYEFGAHAIDDMISVPRYAVGQMPLSLPFPVHLHHRISFHLPDAWNLDDTDQDLSSAAFEVEIEMQNKGRTLTYDFDYTSRVDHLPQEAVATHVEDVQRLRSELGRTITCGAGGVRGVPVWVDVLVISLLPLSFVSWLLVVPRVQSWHGERRKRRFQRGLAVGSGEVPASAGAIPGVLQRRRCGRCRKRGVLRAEPLEEAILGDQRLLVQRFRCEACQEEARLYFTLRRSV